MPCNVLVYVYIWRIWLRAIDQRLLGSTMHLVVHRITCYRSFDSGDDSLVAKFTSRQNPAPRETKRPVAGRRRRSVQRRQLKKRRKYWQIRWETARVNRRKSYGIELGDISDELNTSVRFRAEQRYRKSCCLSSKTRSCFLAKVDQSAINTINRIY